MRSFLGWLILVALLGAVGYVAAPLVVRPLVADAVRAVSPFGAEPLEVDVDVDTLRLLRGTIDSVHVSGTNLTSERLVIGRLDATATSVALGDRSFSSMSGSLDGVVLRGSDGAEVQAQRVQLSGPSDAVEAVASLSPDAAIAIVRKALDEAGLSSENLALVDGGVRMSVLGQTADVALGAADGAVTIAGSNAGGGTIVVFGPEPGDPWRITGISVSPDGIEVNAVVDLGSLLRSR